MAEKIHVVLASDNNYAVHLGAVAISILENTKHAHELCFHVLADKISETLQKKLHNKISSYGAELFFYDIKEDLFSHVYTSAHITKAAYFRLILADLLPATIKKVIYLDTDMVILDDISLLWNVNLEGNLIGAVEDLGILSSSKSIKEKQIYLNSTDKHLSYFNSGMLVIDVEQWRREEYGIKALDLLKHSSFTHHDQDILNIIAMNNWKKMDPRWNVTPPVYFLKFAVFTNATLRHIALKARKNIGILHWSGKKKPWHITSYPQFNDWYYHYLSLFDSNISFTTTSLSLHKKIFLYIMKLFHNHQ